MDENDALLRRVYRYYEEDPEDIRDYIKEAFYRQSAGYDQVDPKVWLNTPASAPTDNKAEEVYKVLTETQEV